MRENGKNVRLTQQAHILCSEKAEDCNTSMKAVASEAIFLLVRGEDRDKEQQASMEIYKKRIEILSKRAQDNMRLALGTFVLGAITGGVLMFFIGAAL